MVKKILILGANSEISLEFVRLLNNKSNFYFLLSSKNLSDLKKNYKYLLNKKLIQLDLTKPNKFKNFIFQLDKDLDIVLSFVGYKENPEVNHLKIFKSNFIGLKLLIKKLINQKIFSKIRIIGCTTSFITEKKDFYENSYSLSKYYLSKYLEKINKDKINDLIIKDFKLGIINTRMSHYSKLNKLISSDKVYAAKIIIKNLHNNRNVIYVPYIWKIIIKIYNLVPKKILKYIDHMYKK